MLVLGMFPPVSASASEVEDGQSVETTAAVYEDPQEEPETTEAPAPETTEAPVPETTEEAVPETTVETAPETTGETEPETTGETVPETTGETVPETTGETVPETIEEEPQEGESFGACVPDGDLPGSQELTDGYIYQLFFGGVQTYGTAGRDRLGSDAARSLYDHLKTGIEQIAVGARSSAVFQMAAGDLGIDLTVTAANQDEAAAAFCGKLEFNAVLSALLHDCPYELYWYDKTSGVRYSAGFSYLGDQYTLTSFTVSFQVAGNHQAAGYDPNSPAVDTALANRAVTASANAKGIVTANAGKSDYEKLTAYKEAICGLVSYNTAAAGSGSFSQDDAPWQLIYVFDQDPSTNVVCEGYSKAFQYLCDESSFTDAACYTVTGAMNGGGHMWNIVRLEGKNYLADVTNSDAGSVGQNGGLFLSGAQGSAAGGYTALNVSYVYDSDTQAMWGENVLTLSDTDYTPGAAEHVHNLQPDGQWSATATWHSANCTDCGQYVDEDHRFVNGTCVVCGYQNHAHTLTWMDKSDSNHWGGCSGCGVIVNSDHSYANGVCTDCGILQDHAESHQHHIGNYEITPEWHCAICDECGRLWGDEDNSHDTKGENGTCSVCGYDTNHTHSFDSGDNDIWMNDKVHERTCTVCHLRVEENHTFEGDTCTECGYINHAHTFNWLDKSDGSHWGECAECKRIVTLDHSFGEDGACTTCGALQAHCESHQHNFSAYQIDPYSDEHCPVCDECGRFWGDQDNHHTPDASGACTVCGYKEHQHVWSEGQTYSEESFHAVVCAICGYSEQGDHNFDGNGTCLVCGYKQHVHVMNEFCMISSMAHVYLCTECGAEFDLEHVMEGDTCVVCGYREHEHKGSWQINPRNHYVDCEECGARFFEDHIWNADGSECIVCGCKNHVHTPGSKWISYPGYHMGTCTDCGSTVTEDHVWRDGQCVTCGYEMHDHKVSSWSLHPVTSSYHQGICTDCGTTVIMRHAWDETGLKCSVCGYQAEGHTHSFGGDLWISTKVHQGTCIVCEQHLEENHTYTPGGDTCTACGYVNHEHTWDNEQERGDYDHWCQCAKCGLQIHGDHSYANGVCTVCGIDQSHAESHRHNIVRYEIWAEGHSPVCEQCGSYYDSEAGNNHTPDANGVCTFCGYDPNHTHAFQRIDWMDTKQHHGPCTFGEYADEDHIYNGDDICDICGYVDHEHVVPDRWDLNENHHAGTCSLCGNYVHIEHEWAYGESVGKYCAVCHYRDHTHTNVGYEINSWGHTPICEVCGPYNGEEHIDSNGDGICEACGYDFNHIHQVEPDGNVTATQHRGHCTICGEYVEEDHRFVDGKCAVCGYQDHEHTIIWTDFNDNVHWRECSECGYIEGSHSYDANGVCTGCGIHQSHAESHQHNVIGYVAWIDRHDPVCKECGRYLALENSEHTPDASGACSVCGYQEHDHVWSKDESTFMEDFHYMVCGICGEGVQEPHDFDESGVCRVCGYKQHTHVMNEFCMISSRAHVFLCTECGAEFDLEHVMEGDTCVVCGYREHAHAGAWKSNPRYHYVDCEECGARFLEDHIWNADGSECTVCGYKNHVHTPGDQWTGCLGYHMGACADCGCSITEEHVWLDGKCVICGYKMHDHTVSSWSEHSVSRGYHQGICSDCGAELIERHKWDETGLKCTVCGYTASGHTHSFGDDLQINDQMHKFTCIGCEQYIEEAHTVDEKGTCTVCGYASNHKHNWGYRSSSQGHIRICAICGYAEPIAEHTFNSKKTCTACGYKQHEHVPGKGTVDAVDENTHDLICGVCGEHVGEEPHVFQNVDGVDTCTVCGYMDHEHKAMGYNSITESQHRFVCEECGYAFREDHTFDPGQGFGKICTACGYNRGCDHAPTEWRPNADNHEGICSKCGLSMKEDHSYDETGVCTVCGYDGNHQHVYKAVGTMYNHTPTCECGATLPWEDHIWKGDKCLVCGYQKHTHTVKKWEDFFRYPQTSHTGTCTKCGGTVVDLHTFDVTGRCTVCGYERKERHDYTVTYVLGGGTNSELNPGSYWAGESFDLQDPTWEGYTFDGWYTGADYATPITGITESDTGNLTVYAKWIPNVCAVEYDLGDTDYAPAVNDTSNPVRLYPDVAPTQLKKPTRPGYTFDGWTVDDVPVTALTYDVSGKITVAANWTPIEYKITYKNVPSTVENLNPDAVTPDDEIELRSDLSRPGFTFLGWFTDSKLKNEITQIGPGTTAKLTLYAGWETHTYTVEFDANDEAATGKMTAMTKRKGGSAFSLKANGFKLAGFIFQGWNTEPDGTGYSFPNKAKVTDLCCLTGDEDGIVTLYAQWGPKDDSYSIRLVDEDGTEIDAPDTLTGVDYGRTIKLPKATALGLSRKGYTFAGWISESGITYKDGASVKDICASWDAEVTLRAQWKLVTYKISYTMNGGKKDSGYPASYTVEDGEIDLGLLAEPTRVGYHFEGWYTNSKFTGDPVTSIDTQAAASVKLYAKFGKNTYKLHLNYDDERIEDRDCTYGTGCKLPDASKARDGYTFLNWVDENGKVYKNKTTVKNLTLEHGGEVTLTAQWAKTRFAVRFDANGGGGAMADATGTYGKSVKLPASTLGRRGCVFIGWNTEPDGSGATYKNKASVKLTPDEDGCVVLYAQWASDTYTVVFEPNCKDFEGATPVVQGVSYSKGKQKAVNGFTRAGYTFTGWNTEPDGTGKKIANKGGIKGLSTDATGVVRLYAQWKLVTYKITYSLGGGKNPTGAPKTYCVNSGDIKLPTPTRKGYTFTGWREAASGEIPAGSTGNRKLTAVWSKNS